MVYQLRECFYTNLYMTELPIQFVPGKLLFFINIEKNNVIFILKIMHIYECFLKAGFRIENSTSKKSFGA